MASSYETGLRPSPPLDYTAMAVACFVSAGIATGMIYWPGSHIDRRRPVLSTLYLLLHVPTGLWAWCTAMYVVANLEELQRDQTEKGLVMSACILTSVAEGLFLFVRIIKSKTVKNLDEQIQKELAQPV